MSYYFDAFRMDHILGFFPHLEHSPPRGRGIMGYSCGDSGACDESRAEALGLTATVFAGRTSPINLRQLFGTEAELVPKRLPHTEGLNNYSLKPKFATQRQVETYFSDLEFNDYITPSNRACSI